MSQEVTATGGPALWRIVCHLHSGFCPLGWAQLALSLEGGRDGMLQRLIPVLFKGSIMVSITMRTS